ncbi:MAG: NUDIX hydrolase [Coprobacillus sp.]|nr:NUDIX hydrolase [Coprobacillus sp.]
MKILYKLEDNVYPYTGFTHTRDISRCVLFNEKGEILLNHLVGDDKFGHRDYYELPGGGKDKGETLTSALKREIKEEAGYLIKEESIVPIGRVIDAYNLIGRINNNHYYIAYIDKRCEKDLLDYEKVLIREQIWVSLDEAISLYKSVDTNLSPLATLVINRELPILELVRDKYASLIPHN